MIILVSGLLIFLGAHSIRVYADNWRGACLERMGEMRWKALYSLVSLLGFALIIWGARLSSSTPLPVWVPPIWTRYVAIAMMLPAFMLLVAAYVPGNRIKAQIGHPMVAGTMIWALAHLLSNGTLADAVLFGAFLIWAIADFISARNRDRRAGVNYPVSTVGRDLLVVVVGGHAWALFTFLGHEWLFGVRPFG